MEQNNQSTGGMRLHDKDGARLYLNTAERDAFIAQCHITKEPIKCFCLLLVYTGCRLSEARHLRPQDIQSEEKTICVRTLKRRTKDEYRYVPVPQEIIALLKACRDTGDPERAYVFSDTQFPPPRIQTYRWVKALMAELGFEGAKASPKGLRHTFGAHAILTGVQLQMLQRWMGHASMDTTAIYSTLVGKEEREIAKRMWD